MKSIINNSNSVFKNNCSGSNSSSIIRRKPNKQLREHRIRKQQNSKFRPESAVNVQYIGADEKMFEFKVEFENPTAQKFTLIVKNDDGTVIYSKEYNDIHFAKTIRLMKDGIDGQNIYPTFAISVGTRLVQRSFSIEKKITEDLIVKKHKIK